MSKKKLKLGKVNRSKIRRHVTTTIRLSYGDGDFDLGTLVLDEDGKLIRSEYLGGTDKVISSTFGPNDKVDVDDEIELMISEFEERMAKKASKAESLLTTLERL